MYIYQVYPIDRGWSALQTVQDYIDRPVLYPADEAGDVKATWAQLCKIALQEGFGLDSSETARIMWIPSEVSFKFCIAWKEVDNGTTYIATPFEMTWLDSITMKVVEVSGI